MSITEGQSSRLLQFLAFRSSNSNSSSSASTPEAAPLSDSLPEPLVVSPRVESYSARCHAPSLVLGSATAQGGRHYMEDCHAVHTFQLSAPPPPPCPPHEPAHEQVPAANAHVGSPGHDSGADCDTPRLGCACLPGLVASCSRRFMGSRQVYTSMADESSSDAAADTTRTTTSSIASMSPTSLSPSKPAGHALAIARSQPEPGGAVMSPTHAAKMDAAVGSFGALELQRPAKRPRLPVAAAPAGMHAAAQHPWEAAPMAVPAATHMEPHAASSTQHAVMTATAAAAAAAHGDTTLSQAAVCECGQQPGVHAGEPVVCAQVYDGHGGNETARYAALHMVHFVAHACQRQVELAQAASGSPTAAGLGVQQPTAAPGLLAASSWCLRPEQLHSALGDAFAAFDASLADYVNAPYLYQLSTVELEDGRVPAGDPPSQVPAWYGRAVRRWLKGDEEDPFIGPSAGSTAVVALITRQLITVAGLGDSKAWVCVDREQGLQPLCVEHKATDEAEQARITRAGGWVSRSGRVNSDLDMSRALGDMEFKQAADLPPHEQAVIAVPDVMSIDLTTSPGSGWLYLLLATDGLSNACSEAQIHQVVMQHVDAGCKDPAVICRRLCDLACEIERSAADNVTALIVLPA